MPYKDPEKRKAYIKEYMKQNPEKFAKAAKKWEAKNPGHNKKRALKYSRSEHGRRKQRDYMLKNAYDITVDEYDLMFENQDGNCAICNQPEVVRSQSGRVISLAVDHDHSNGRVRGLLCARCNTVLGHTDDNLELLCKMMEYLYEYRS